jgi:hypothetical protein
MWVIATSNENEAYDSLGGIPHLNYIPYIFVVTCVHRSHTDICQDKL